jgi:hypothetical protein
MLTKIEIEKYFIAEKAESLVFVLLGLLGVIGSTISFFIVKLHFTKAHHFPFLHWIVIGGCWIHCVQKVGFRPGQEMYMPMI